MNIREFLSKVSEDEVASDLGVSIHIVRKWRTGKRNPSRKNALALIEWSHGVLTLDGIYIPPETQEIKAA